MDTELLVIGAGISGIATAKCALEAGMKVIVVEKSSDIGGLWTYRKYSYGVTATTHINVSKYNYCFSDYPFEADEADFVSHRTLSKYIKNYCLKFNVFEHICMRHKVKRLEKIDKGWIAHIAICREPSPGVLVEAKEIAIRCNWVAIATGHHSEPKNIKISGLETFPGKIIHPAEYKSVDINKCTGKRTLVIGIGNSAVDAATDLADHGAAVPVHLSTRSGAWIASRYIFGMPIDLYASRFLIYLPWKWLNYIYESILTLIFGHPNKWGLNPQMKALQTQPTVSDNLYYHIQRRNIVIQKDVEKIEKEKITFCDGKTFNFDVIVLCTGFVIKFDFLTQEHLETFLDSSTNEVSLYKNVFSPNIGSSLAFIGLVQPSSGGILSCSEVQARWFIQICQGYCLLPNLCDMMNEIEKDRSIMKKRFYNSPRHTIQRDPVAYCDEICSMFGAKPSLIQHHAVAFRLIFGCAGPFQYRLNGPHSWSEASNAISSIPVSSFSKLVAFICIFTLLFLMLFLLSVINSL